MRKKNPTYSWRTGLLASTFWLTFPLWKSILCARSFNIYRYKWGDILDTVYEKIFDFFKLQFQLGFYFSIDKYKKQYLKEKKWRVTPPPHPHPLLLCDWWQQITFLQSYRLFHSIGQLFQLTKAIWTQYVIRRLQHWSVQILGNN